MAKHPPEIYSPGELDKVRKNLGSVSPDEAKRIASLLGGEVGVEKSPQAVNRSYQKTSRKTTSVPPAPGHIDPSVKSSGGARQDAEGESVNDKPLRAHRVPYIDRMRKNFLASRKDYRVKSVFDSILGLFPFLRIPDLIHPQFILESRKRLMEPLEEFVSSVRKIFSMKNEEFLKAVSKNGLYMKIVRVICAWDTENIHKELSKLRLQPERVSFSDCGSIVESLYKPFIILKDVTVEDHIRKAIEFCFNNHLMFSPVESRAELKKAAETALSLVTQVFYEIRQTCYPILLKNIPSGFLEYQAFFNGIPDEALYYLNLTPESILNPAAELTGPPRESGEPDSLETDTEQGTDDPPTGETPAPDTPADHDSGKTRGTSETIPENTEGKIAAFPQGAQKGMENLDKLFPENGLSNMENRPDLFALLQKEFQSVSSFDMIPNDDPLLQVVFLHRVLNELFYGFRAIEFGTSTGTDSGMLEDIIEPILDIWPYFTSEILEKQYFPRLLELQQQSERNPDFLRSEYGRKLNSDLKWTRRLYLLPYQEIESAAGIRRATKIPDAPVLSETLSTLKTILTDITSDMERTLSTLREQGVPHSGEFSCMTIHNPWSKYKFEIENPVSSRLSKLLVKKVKMPDGSIKTKDLKNNANLVSITASIVDLFDFLVNSETSYFYRDQPVWLFKRIQDEAVPDTLARQDS